MRCFQSVIVLLVLIMMSVICKAQGDELTMEVIESLDDVNIHHRIMLPRRIVAQEVINKKQGKAVADQGEENTEGDQYKVQRDQLNILINDNQDDYVASDVAKSRELRQNSVENASDTMDNEHVNNQMLDNVSELNESIADSRKEMIERHQEIIDEIRDTDEPGPVSTSAALIDE